MYIVGEGFDTIPEFIEYLSKENFPLVTTNKGISYYNIPAAFDIEVSSFYIGEEKMACMYIWMLGIGNHVTYGRTWDELTKLLEVIRMLLSLSDSQILTIYVHNLAYEFQFIRKRFRWDKVFLLDERKPVYAISNGIEFKCSLKLSGKALAKVGEDLQRYKVKKLVGSLDYDLIRTSSTELTKQEMKYCENDIRVLLSYIQTKIEDDGDITKIPLTNTGYVRNYCRKACFKRWKRYKQLMDSLVLEPEEYVQLKRAFQGGFTHANARKVGDIHENVGSFDFTSSYPAVMLSEKFPMSKSRLVNKTDITDDELKYYFTNYCCLFDIEFENLEPITNIDHPISVSKCWGYDRKATLLDNGRVVYSPKIATTITEQDYFVYKQFYTWDTMEIFNLRIYEKGYLPKPFIEAILQLYEDKTKLKDVPGEEVLYMLSKNMLNSAYGMTVTDIVRTNWEYSNNEFSSLKPDLVEAIKKYNTNIRRFLFYPWGVWVTAYARSNLFSGILESADDYIYSDTDSIKILNYEKHFDYIERYNKEITEQLYKMAEWYRLDKERLSPLNRNGKAKPLGVWEFEGTYKKFKTLGAKRYLTETDKGISITVAGVNKKSASEYLSKSKDPFNEFRNNLTVPVEWSGRQIVTYIDYETSGTITDYKGNPGEFSELSSIHMEGTQYSLTIPDEFIKYCLGVRDDSW